MHDLVLRRQGVERDCASCVVEMFARRRLLLMLCIVLVDALIVVFNLLQGLFLFVFCLLDHHDFFLCFFHLLLALPVCDGFPELRTLRVHDCRASRPNSRISRIDPGGNPWISFEVLQASATLHPLLRLHLPCVDVLRHDIVNVCVGEQRVHVRRLEIAAVACAGPLTRLGLSWRLAGQPRFRRCRRKRECCFGSRVGDSLV